jgi:hypothetical protein
METLRPLLVETARQLLGLAAEPPPAPVTAPMKTV